MKTILKYTIALGVACLVAAWAFYVTMKKLGAI